MHDRHHPDLRVRIQIGVDGGRVDGVVIADFDLVELRPDRRQPVAEALAEHAAHEIETGHPRRDDGAGGRLEAEHGLALHEDDLVVVGPEDPADPFLRRPEALLEDRIVVVQDRRAERCEDLGRKIVRSGAQGQVSAVHRRLLRLVRLVRQSGRLDRRRAQDRRSRRRARRGPTRARVPGSRPPTP